ncbi:hypothetical protein NW754_007915 [Fusarium falciforme]|uniref:Uncharacterized protein n=1 Tax=Fusarium falciforme TaxID=195108 RepID=A0A9W8QV10_9HYPO|nr:hypothetical protein NW754_007915 [Fusarium falciforme]KAJ4178387.1 hypothetical protein NW755_013226 [Fusarium falciforme]KAJ4182991.1 hypothetical protein NW767_013671 [Fusarium falciforme]KAJ4246487.1 hypothetical protein NW757_009536 [Fusarium falciforme]
MTAAATGPLDTLGILEELNNAKANCEGDRKTLAEFARATSDDIEVLLMESRVTKWVAQFMCRLIGVDAGPQSDEKWWTGDSEPREAAAALNEDLHMRIDQSFRRLTAGQVVKATRTSPGLTPAAKAERDAKAHDLAGRALAYLKPFLELQQNGSVSLSVTGDIAILESYVRQMGFRYRLEAPRAGRA